MNWLKSILSDPRFHVFLAGLIGYAVSHFFGYIQAPEWLQEHQAALDAVIEISESLTGGVNGGG